MSMSRLIKAALKVLGITVLTIALFVTSVAALGESLKGEEPLSPWGTGFFIVTSGSMEPKYPIGSVVFVTSVAKDAIKQDDVLTYFSSGRNEIITHRVREVYPNGTDTTFITRGDANSVDDAPLEYDRVIGRVLFAVPVVNHLIGSHENAIYVGTGLICFGFILCLAGLIGNIRKKRVLALAGAGGPPGVEISYDDAVVEDVINAIKARAAGRETAINIARSVDSNKSAEKAGSIAGGVVKPEAAEATAVVAAGADTAGNSNTVSKSEGSPDPITDMTRPDTTNSTESKELYKHSSNLNNLVGLSDLSDLDDLSSFEDLNDIIEYVNFGKTAKKREIA